MSISQRSTVPRPPPHLTLAAPLADDIFNPTTTITHLVLPQLIVTSYMYDPDPQPTRPGEPAGESRSRQQIDALLVNARQHGHHAKAPGNRGAIHGQADDKGCYG